jgi:hypothetical protein
MAETKAEGRRLMDNEGVKVSLDSRKYAKNVLKLKILGIFD